MINLFFLLDQHFGRKVDAFVSDLKMQTYTLQDTAALPAVGSLSGEVLRPTGRQVVGMCPQSMDSLTHCLSCLLWIYSLQALHEIDNSSEFSVCFAKVYILY